MTGPEEREHQPTVDSDVFAVADSVLRRVVGAEPTTDLDLPTVIARHGLDEVIDYLAKLSVVTLREVARARGCSPKTVVDDYLSHLLVSRSEQVRDMVRRQVSDGIRAQIRNAGVRDEFLGALLAMHVNGVIEHTIRSIENRACNRPRPRGYRKLRIRWLPGLNIPGGARGNRAVD